MSIVKESNYVCASCGVAGYKRPSHLNKSKNHFCSYRCSNKFRYKKIETECMQCKKMFMKLPSDVLIGNGKNFCCMECKNNFQIKKREVECLICKKIFLKKRSEIKRAPNNYCSRECFLNYINGRESKKIKVECIVCKKLFLKLPCEIKRAPRHCCSRNCYYILNREHKDWGSKRSKLEISIEEHLKTLYSFEIRYNKTDIGYELDIYIPCLNLAIEINGILHYEAIFGDAKLLRTQQIDMEKIVKCNELGIKLFVINVSRDGAGKKIQAQRISEVEKIVRDRINELGYVFKSKQMVMNL